MNFLLSVPETSRKFNYIFNPYQLFWQYAWCFPICHPSIFQEVLSVDCFHSNLSVLWVCSWFSPISLIILDHILILVVIKNSSKNLFGELFIPFVFFVSFWAFAISSCRGKVSICRDFSVSFPLYLSHYSDFLCLYLMNK